MKKPATKAVIALLFVVALLHLARILLYLDISVEQMLIPRWASLATFASAIGLGVMVLDESGE